MPFGKGKIVLMGSGELTATMVEVHKGLIANLGKDCSAIFLDTPAGFQLNADMISEQAVSYFQKRVRHPLSIASFKSSENTAEFEVKKTFHDLRKADYILVGPGSPTYAVRHLRPSPIPDILIDRIESGGCLVAASAAALTLGRFTLPVYELYKVGQGLHWVDGLNILDHFGFNLVVIPHWNNAEGGNHDTRFCFMGESRFHSLEALLPNDVSILGLDEHTACIIDLESKTVETRGIGRVIFRQNGVETVFQKGACLPLNVLFGESLETEAVCRELFPEKHASSPESLKDTFIGRIRELESVFHQSMVLKDPEKATNMLLELDKMICQGQQQFEDEEHVSQAREVLRDLIVAFGINCRALSKSPADILEPLVSDLLQVRENLRKQKDWAAADAIRESLNRANILIEDTRDGSSWRIK